MLLSSRLEHEFSHPAILLGAMCPLAGPLRAEHKCPGSATFSALFSEAQLDPGLFSLGSPKIHEHFNFLTIGLSAGPNPI